MKASLPSGSRKPIELLAIETDKFSLVIKGKLDFSKHVAQSEDTFMQFFYEGKDINEIEIYDVDGKQLIPYNGQSLYPIFFENGMYEVIIIPQKDLNLNYS